MEFSDFGNKFRGGTGIAELMQDLASAPNATGNPALELGGGNPGYIPQAVAAFTEQLHHYADNPANFSKSSTRYGSPQGQTAFIASLVSLLNGRYNWSITDQNVVLTNGSQNAFFMLFNLLAGKTGSTTKKILLPMAPEYIGYEDVAIGEPIFVSQKPVIDLIGKQQFKYRLDKNALSVTDDIAAICVSRPTNPTGNVLTDEELAWLDQLALSNNVPLIIDNAYGAPFPNIINVPATLHWHENIVLSLSLSKLGLPGPRTGIVIARPEIIAALTQMNAVMNLAPTALCPAIMQPLFEDGSILDLCDQYIQPFYQQRASDAMDWFQKAFEHLPARAHCVEGAIFLWLWFPQLPIGSAELYQRLKNKGVVVVAGHYFFPGLNTPWDHKQQCIRVNIGGDAQDVKSGLELIAEEIRTFS
ncbi:UNVERIFIED_CONTAM: hypothetical protein GTU68_013710 [Idotea baltica]|nr:hypothetical protein [Idotea baltica]